MDFDLWKSDDEFKNLWIDLELNNRCNYSCSYCNPWNWSKTEPWADVDKLLKLISVIPNKFPKKKIRQYNLMGGEPAVTPKFHKLVTGIKSLDPESQIILTTNGSRTTRWFEETAQYLDYVNFSIHLERVNLEEINQKMKVCVEQGCWVVANVMMDANNWQKAVDAVDFFFKSGYSHLIFTKPLEDILTSRVYQKYNDDQLNYILNWTNEKSSARLQNCLELHVNPRKLKSDFYSANILHNGLPYNHDKAISFGLTNFNGWKCWIGTDSFKVNINGTVAGGVSCSLGKNYGNYMETDPDTWDWSNSPVTCSLDICTCGSDLLSRKFKNHTLSETEFKKFNTER